MSLIIVDAESARLPSEMFTPLAATRPYSPDINRFTSPQSHHDEKGYGMDSWSVALILFELFNGTPLVGVGAAGASLCDTVTTDARFNVHDYITRLSKSTNPTTRTAEANLIVSMLAPQPASRPTLAQAYNAPSTFLSVAYVCDI
jgi:serine/threonine protein kinase